jgi:chromosome segregation ATPase
MPVTEIIASIVTVLVSMIGSGLLLALINRKRDDKKSVADIDIQSRDQKIEEQAAEISNTERSIQIAYGLLPRLQAEITLLKQELQDLREAFDKQTDTVSAQLKRIVSLQTTLETQSDTIKQMQAMITVQAQQIEERGRVIVHQQGEIDRLLAQVARLEKVQRGQTGELKMLHDNNK